MLHAAQIISRQITPEPEWVRTLSAIFPRHTALFARILQARNIQEPQALSNSMKDLIHYRTMRGLNVAVQVLADAVEQDLRIVIVGDFDADGEITIDDVLLLLTYYGCTTNCEPYDGNGDGIVSVADILMFLQTI